MLTRQARAQEMVSSQLQLEDMGMARLAGITCHRQAREGSKTTSLATKQLRACSAAIVAHNSAESLLERTDGVLAKTAG